MAQSVAAQLLSVPAHNVAWTLRIILHTTTIRAGEVLTESCDRTNTHGFPTRVVFAKDVSRRAGNDAWTVIRVDDAMQVIGTEH